jgi:hypothetical protein
MAAFSLLFFHLCFRKGSILSLSEEQSFYYLKRNHWIQVEKLSKLLKKLTNFPSSSPNSDSERGSMWYEGGSFKPCALCAAPIFFYLMGGSHY